MVQRWIESWVEAWGIWSRYITHSGYASIWMWRDVPYLIILRFISELSGWYYLVILVHLDYHWVLISSGCVMDLLNPSSYHCVSIRCICENSTHILLWRADQNWWFYLCIPVHIAQYYLHIGLILCITTAYCLIASICTRDYIWVFFC